MKLKVYSVDGNEAGRSVTLDDSVYGIEPNDHVVWLDVRRIQANARQGTHKTKERGEVAGSTRKLYRQKGTGNARAGSARSPVRRSGGRTFGPRPRNYGFKVNRKTQRLARRSALSYKTKDGALRIVEDFSYDVPKTQSLKDMIAGLDLAGQKVLLLTTEGQQNVYLSGRNVEGVTVRAAAAASTLDVMNAAVVLVQEGAVELLSTNLSR
ncbi:MAG: 50S ribosomal protein L4 [Rhodothermales bacterium]|nr:50S ribosomal protein L4 [Rhodothermales bacterium]